MIETCLVCNAKRVMYFRKLCNMCYDAWKETEMNYATWLLKLPSRTPSALERLQYDSDGMDARTMYSLQHLYRDLEHTKERSLLQQLFYGR